MEKVYLLENLDCANCAMKIESKVGKLKGVHQSSVDFVQKKMYVTFDGDVQEAIKDIVVALEPDVNVVDITKNKKEHEEHHEHEHSHCGCGHDHEEHHHDHCACDHDEQHEHGKCCGHSHEEHEEHVMTGAHKLYIKGLDCANCAHKIEQHVAHMENVKDASLNFSNGVLFVELKDHTLEKDSLDKIVKAVLTLEDGISVERVKTTVEEKKHSLFSFYENWRLYMGILLFAIAIMLEKESYSLWIFIVAYIFAGGRVVYIAIKNILRGEVFDENFLMSVATLGAFFVQSYKEAVAVMIFYEVGEMFQSYAVQKSRTSISSLMNIRADHANKLVDGKEMVVDPQELKVSDIIVLKPGERVPMDGVVIEGIGAMDTSALTGESMPRDVQEGDEILAGVVNLNSVLKVRVTKEYGESTVSRILELVENASSKKAPMEKFITKFARIYTPVVVGLAVLLVVLPMVFIKDAVFYDWLYRALTFLVVSCPCALVVSIPLGLFAGIGAASKRGILIKGGNYLEALHKIDTVVFDKTGTLTKGVFALRDIYVQDATKEEVLQLAAYGESHSSHPIALSIAKAYGKEIDTTRLSQYEEIAGQGIQVKLDGSIVLVGNHKLMKANHIEFQDTKETGTIVHVAKDHVYMGYLLIDDVVKETSKQAIQDLKKLGVSKTVMLSGDRKEVGEHVASILGLDEVYMQLLPVDKVEKVEMLLEQMDEEHKLAFVGDGINDAPVLARADIGVAMGGIGSDAAIEAADVVLMKDDPSSLATAMSISKKTMRILWQNIIISLGVKAIILIFTAFGFANMWMGVFADVGVTLLAVLNSMRALKVE
ncbi:MAG: heavy metal translocating P-type ATPase [Longicatena sp.]